MKKAYIAPAVETININGTATILAGSIDTYDAEVDTSLDDVQLGREDKLSNPDLWNQGW